MTYISDYKARINANGNSLREINITNTKSAINASFADNPSYETVTIDSVSTGVILNNGKDSLNKEMLLLPDATIAVGKLVIIDNYNWLVLDSTDNEMYPKCKINKTNHLLKWLDSTGTTKSTYGVTSNKSLTDVTDENKYIILPDGKFRITIPDDADTRLIIKDKRFIINNSAWKCTFNDYTTIPGLCVIYLDEDTIGVNDDLTLGIADYNSQHLYALSVLNGDLTLVEDATAQINCVLTDNGVVVSSPVLTYESNDEDICTVSNSGLVTALDEVGTTTIDVSYGTAIATINVTVQATPVANNYSMEISGDSIIKVSQSKTYTVKTYNNGVLISSLPCTFSLNNNNCSVTSQTDNDVIIKAGVTSGVTSTLRVELDSDPTVFATLTISVNSIW